MLAIISLVGVDLPFADGWDTPGGLLEAGLDGRLGPTDFFEQHNESRPLFPRLFFYVFAHVFGWHPKAFMLLSWVVTVSVACLASRWLVALGRGPLPLWGAFVVSSFLFSLAQYANFLWGIQCVVFIPSLCLVLALEVARCVASYRAVFASTIVLCVLATFSYANGMLLWLVAAPFFVLVAAWRKGEFESARGWAGVYVLCGAVSLLCYFSDYSRPPTHASMMAGLEDPLSALVFFASWVGAPFSDVFWGLDDAPWAGAGLLCSAVVALALLFGRVAQEGGGAVLRLAAPWLALLAYGVISGLVTTVGRVGDGPQAALAQRYAMQVVWVPIGVTGVVCVLRMRPGARVSWGRASFERVLLAVLSGFALVSWLNGAVQIEQYDKQLRQNALSLALIDSLPENPLLARIHPIPRDVVRRAHRLGEQGLLSVPRLGSWVTDAPRGIELADGRVRVRSFDDPQTKRRQLLVEGTARIPETGRPADAVLLARVEEEGREAAWTALVVRDRDESSGERVGFRDVIEVPLALDPSRIRAFAIDEVGRRSYRLRNRLQGTGP